jgi:transposase-like protein
MIGARMNDEVEVRPISVMRRTGKKYNKLLKSQAIRAHLNGTKFADVSKQFGPCEDTVRKWVAAYLAGSLTLPGLDPVTPRSLVKQAKVQSEESWSEWCIQPCLINAHPPLMEQSRQRVAERNGQMWGR